MDEYLFIIIFVKHDGNEFDMPPSRIQLLFQHSSMSWIAGVSVPSLCIINNFISNQGVHEQAMTINLKTPIHYLTPRNKKFRSRTFCLFVLTVRCKVIDFASKSDSLTRVSLTLVRKVHDDWKQTVSHVCKKINIHLTHLLLVPHICSNELDQRWFR